jgi:hypothetical protein
MISRSHRVRLVAVVVAALVVLGTASAYAKPLSEKNWRKQASAICNRTNRDIGAIDAEVFVDYTEPTPEQLSSFLDQALPVFDRAVAAIDALDEPKALKRDVKRLVAAATAELEALRTNPQLLIETEGNAIPRTTKISRKLRITCGQEDR